MINDILIVDSVDTVLNAWMGITYYNNQIIQELGGQYFFIDVNEECEKVKSFKNDDSCEKCPNFEQDVEICDKCIEAPRIACGDCSKCIKPLPLKIAWFIIQAIRLQRQAYSLSIPPTDGGIREVFTKLESQEG